MPQCTKRVGCIAYLHITRKSIKEIDMTKSIYPKLLTYAYNIVGTYEDSHDIVQDAMEKYIGIDKSKIDNEVNYLIKTVVNLAINHKKRSQKFSKYGVWLPEPITTEGSDAHLLKEQVANYSLLVLFEKLNIKERAVFILREGFEYKHDEIADVLEISSDNSRQLMTRAKKKLNNASFASQSTPKEQLVPYVNAMLEADTKKLEELLSEDVNLMADGGDSIKVVTNITTGKKQTAELLQYVYAMFLDGKEYKATYINHQPALCFMRKGAIFSCMVFHFDSSGKLDSVYSIVDPYKLKSIGSPNNLSHFESINCLITKINTDEDITENRHKL